MKKLLIGFVVAAALGCAASEEGVTVPGDETSPECRLTSDCRPGEFCSDGVCTPVVPEEPGCRGNVDCGADRPYCDRSQSPAQCTACTVVQSRETGAFVDVGCQRGQECHDGDCVWVDMTCTSEDRAARGLDCAPNRPHCLLGQCVQCLVATDCPRHDDASISVKCTPEGTCAYEAVGACEASVDCDDGDRCTTDVCRFESARCEHVAIAGCGEDHGGTDVPPPAGESITLRWTTPSGARAASLVMSTKVDADPSRLASEPLVELCRAYDSSEIGCAQSGLTSGMRLQVSVEYRMTTGGSPSWSCLGDGTGGVINGTLFASALSGGRLLIFRPASNGLTHGCNLEATVP